MAGGRDLASALRGEHVDSRSSTNTQGLSRSTLPSRLVRDGLKRGTLAPAFSLPDLEGTTISLSDYLGKQVLLVFSDPACGPCQTLLPELERVHRRSSDQQILMISRGDLQENRAKAAQHHASFPIVLQRHWEISRAYGMFATPIGYLIDRKGVLASDVSVGVDSILQLVADDISRDERAQIEAAS